MAQHQEDCEICHRLAQCASGENPGLIAEMETGYAVLGDSQYFRGYSLLLCKTPATELDELAPDVRLKYLEEMALLAQSIRTVVKPHKLNYECLGNAVHHLHWHIFPRYLDDEHLTGPVWAHDAAKKAQPQYAFNLEQDTPLINEIRAELKRLTEQRQQP